MCNRFLTSKAKRLKSGELSERSFRDYYVTCQNVIQAFDRERVVEDLTAVDYDNLRAKLAENRGPVALGNEIGRVRMVFKYADDQG